MPWGPFVGAGGGGGEFEAGGGVECGLATRRNWCLWLLGGTPFLEVTLGRVVCHCIVIIIGGWAAYRRLCRTCILARGKCHVGFRVPGGGGRFM